MARPMHADAACRHGRAIHRELGMGAILWEWLNFGVRWLHVIAGIAWIGSSFYFVHLDLSLKPRKGLPEEAYGEAWQVHGGGFYNMVKYLVAPRSLPDKLTWFKWEAYTTWLSGAALLVLVYYMGAELYLIDESVLPLPAWAAIALSVGGLALGWLVYDGLCRSPLGRNDTHLAIAGFVFLVALSYGFSHVFSGRGAFMQMGALIGTMMVANVFLVIIPNQRKVVAALIAGQTPDPSLGAKGKQRSLHNNYLTLPVVFVMIGNHYPLAFATQYSWAILACIIVMGALIRHFFNTMHKTGEMKTWPWFVSALLMLLVMFLSALGPKGPVRGTMDAAAPAGPVTFARVEEIVTSRCSMCHAMEPVWDGVVVPPKNVLLENGDEIHLRAHDIAMQAAFTHAMPPGNVTQMTPAERAVLARWFEDGARRE
nr:MAG: cysteine desulfurase [Pseudomonadota bacterium]